MGYRRPTSEELGGGRIQSIKRVLWIILFLNLAVAFAKIAAGTIANSSAMQADGFHSIFDGASNVVGLVGMSFASRPADDDHPYGHAKYETYASAIIGAMLLLAAYRIGSEAIAQIVNPTDVPDITTLSFVVMIGTLAINLFITTWERRVGKKLGSSILVADASHTGSDVLVSVGVIVSLILVKFFNMPLADPIVALLVCVAIVYTAWGVFKHASATLSDSVADRTCGGVCGGAGGAGRQGLSLDPHARFGGRGLRRPAHPGRPRVDSGVRTPGRRERGA